jgi:hypothetical protein
MWKSLVYKEWLKTRGLLIISLFAGLLVLLYIFLEVRHSIVFIKASDLWYNIIFRGHNYSSILKFVPPIIGLAVALAQYIPEVVNKRIKLTFHLPLNEDNALLVMQGFGFISLILLFTIYILALFSGSYIYFPHEITNSILMTNLPWFLGGFATYFMTSFVILEPVWFYKVLYILVAYSFVSLFYLSAVQRAYIPSIITFIILTLLSSIVILFSGYRFKKGEI